MTDSVEPPRGVLKYPSAPGVFHHARVAPLPVLAHVIRHVWIVRWEFADDTPQIGANLPHPNVHLVFEAETCRVQGVVTGRFTRTLAGRGAVLGVKFRSGCFRPWLGSSVSSLRDRSIDAQSVFGPQVVSLARQLCSMTDDGDIITSVSDFLLARLPPPDPQAERVAAMVETIEADRTLLRVDQLLEKWHVGKRSVQRLFNEYAGIGPKWVINRYRMHEALEQLHRGLPVNWANLALELGYFDQSHFIRDFRSLVGHSPLEYAKRVHAGEPPVGMRS